MSVDFQQLHKQVRQLGDQAKQRESGLHALRAQAGNILQASSGRQAELGDKVDLVVRRYEPTLRSARPFQEPINASYPCPPMPTTATLIAADGSQINPDRHAEIDYCLINVGAIQVEIGTTAAPRPYIKSELFYDDQLYTPQGMLTEGMLALMRDLGERQALARLAAEVTRFPVITFTDGPLELWGSHDTDRASSFQEKLAAYLDVLKKLRRLDVTTAGYVDKPGANLVVRLLEVASTPESDLEGFREHHPLRGVTDRWIFQFLLPPENRSAVFSIQSKSARAYQEDLSLHFFYLNIGYEGRPYLARVEIPAWVAKDQTRVGYLHSVLVNQCRILGARPYPYLLHRAHETAVVTHAEKEQLTQIITLEMRRRGIMPEGISAKQALKNLGGSTRYR